LAWGDGERLLSVRKQFSGNRGEVRRQTVETALAGLLRLLTEENPLMG
jgi:nicotinamide-nucleotide amidase